MREGIEKLPFVKMQGAGNDFVMIDGRHRLPYDLPVLARALCNRHFGIGADGMVVVEPSSSADFRMLYFNSDGSSSVCGNGMRCAARFIYRLGALPPEERSLALETDTDIVSIGIIGKGEKIRVEMAVPHFDAAAIPAKGQGEQINIPLNAGGVELTVTAVSMGNPHCVVFVPSVRDTDVAGLGAKIRYHDYFPKGVNVEFVEVVDPSHVRMRVYERGVEAETLACGTGNCATIAAGVRTGRLARQIRLDSPGGEFQLMWPNDSARVTLIGPAEEVFSGQCDARQLLAHAANTF